MRTYEKYKDSGISWISKVPNGWERIRIKYGLRQSIAGVWGEEKKNDENDVVCYRMADFNYDKGVLNLDNVTYRNILPQQLAGRTVRKGDLILEKSGGGDLYPVGRVVRVNSDQKATCSNFAHTIATNSNISSNFLYYYFFNLYSKGVSRLFFNQTTGIQNLKVGDYLSQDMYAPSKSEQEAIANYLDKKTAEIDKIIAEREKKIEFLNELKSSIISRAVTKGINTHAKMKDSGIDWFPFIPCNWEYSSLRHVCKKITDGSHFSPMSQLEGKPYITVTNVRNNKVYVEEALKISDEDFRTLVSTGCQPLPGDILLSKDGTVGRTAIVTSNDYVVLSSLGILRPSSLVDSKYLEYCLNSNALQMQMQMMMDGSALRRITIKKICNLLVLIPPMHEQLSIVKYLDKKIAEVNNSISTIRKECALYKEYKQSLISEVVTGKRKVID